MSENENIIVEDTETIDPNEAADENLQQENHNLL